MIIERRRASPLWSDIAGRDLASIREAGRVESGFNGEEQDGRAAIAESLPSFGDVLNIELSEIGPSKTRIDQA